MLVTPLPGVDRKELSEALRTVHSEASTLYRNQTQKTYQRLLAYLDWASLAEEKLSSLVSSADLDRLVLTKRHDALDRSLGTLAGTATEVHVNRLISLELDQRIKALGEAESSLSGEIGRWQHSDYFIVADSSFYIQHMTKFKETDFAAVVNFSDGPVCLLMPMMVVDELDKLKEHRDKHVRWRAAHTLGVLEELHRDTGSTHRLRDADRAVQASTGIRRGEVNVEILFDPPRHVRLPIEDDEIIDRTVSSKPLIGRQVTLLTYDTGQAMRGRAAGLEVIKLGKPAEPEPTS